MSRMLYVCFTMDVERIKAQSPGGGPPSWEFGALAVRSYCDFLLDKGFPVTLFAVPDAAERQAQLLREMAGHGHECGMHFHPESWRDHYTMPGKFDYLGSYAEEEQHRLLGRGREQWADAMGAPPAAFRPGNFSANDATFAVLRSLGFRCGSVSQPGRHVPSIKAVWSDAWRGVHRAHPAFRLIPGDLDFVEVPMTTDTTQTSHWTGVGDARFEDWSVPDILRAVGDSLRWQTEKAVPLSHLCLFTHNFVNYAKEDGEQPTRLPVLGGVVEALPEVAAQQGMEIRGATISGLRQAFLEHEGK